jgi:hypothetical protein
MIDFHNTRSVRWTIDELLGKGPWHEHVIADLAG